MINALQNIEKSSLAAEIISAVIERQAVNRRALTAVFAPAQCLARQDLALRGYAEYDSNVQVLMIGSCDVSALKKWLKLRDNCWANHIQSEILCLCANLFKKIV